ncbi:hypothetical protein DXV76_20795 [Rhodobacteraceae bacterium CCMM004]|nr:hypothetical protein DXV76_20795 [Rhodobacteraceae bacterium CCMM004]
MATVAKDLWRANRKAGMFKKSLTTGTAPDVEPKLGVLYPDFEPRTFMARGEEVTRPADVSYADDGEVEPGGGTSLFDVEGVFGSGAWRYFLLPQDTEIPDTLVVRKTGFNRRFNAEHWQIEVRIGMTLPVDAMKGALDNLARNAITKRYENAH